MKQLLILLVMCIGSWAQGPQIVASVPLPHDATPDPKDAQIAALTARVSQLEKRVALLEEFKKTAWPLIQTLVAPLNAVEQQLAQLDAQKDKK